MTVSLARPVLSEKKGLVAVQAVMIGESCGTVKRQVPRTRSKVAGRGIECGWLGCDEGGAGRGAS